MRRKPVPINSITFWINAFIPKDIYLDKAHTKSYTRPIPNGGGKTMIEAPPENIVLQRLPDTLSSKRAAGSTLPNIGIHCYGTDQRGWSNDPDPFSTSSRMHSIIRIDYTKFSRETLTSFTMDQFHQCGLTTQYDCQTGRITFGPERASTTHMKFYLTDRNPNRIKLHFKCAAGHPASYAAQFFGKIDYSGRITIDLAARTLDLQCWIDAFPFFEAYATINDKPGVNLFYVEPPEGNTVARLPGDANRFLRRRLCDSSGTGQFDDSCRYLSSITFTDKPNFI